MAVLACARGPPVAFPARDSRGTSLARPGTSSSMDAVGDEGALSAALMSAVVFWAILAPRSPTGSGECSLPAVPAAGKVFFVLTRAEGAESAFRSPPDGWIAVWFAASVRLDSAEAGACATRRFTVATSGASDFERDWCRSMTAAPTITTQAASAPQRKTVHDSHAEPTGRSGAEIATGYSGSENETISRQSPQRARCSRT